MIFYLKNNHRFLKHKLWATNDIYHVMIWKSGFLPIVYVRASKWVQNDPQAQKQLQILKAHTFTFPMIYIMSRYEKVDFLMYELQNGFRMALKPFNPPPPLPPSPWWWWWWWWWLGGRVLSLSSQSSILSFLFSQSSILNPQFSGFLYYKLA